MVIPEPWNILLDKVYLFTWEPWATWMVSGNNMVYGVVFGCVVIAGLWRVNTKVSHVGDRPSVCDKAQIKTLETKAG